MKKLFGLLALFLIMACDDGEMTFNTFNFGTAAVQVCSNDDGLLYKVNGTQALILDLDPASLVNIPTGTTPRIVTLNNSNRLIYRNYSGSVAAASICNSLAPATPVVLEEWQAQPGGTVRIVTSAIINEEGVTTGYSHDITLMAITLVNGDQTTIINETDYGTYNKQLGYTFNFLDDDNDINLNSCTDSNLVFRVNGSEALIFNVSPSLFPNSTTTVTHEIINNPNVAQVIFNRYTGSASTNLFCTDTPPITPTVQTQWFAVGGQLQVVSAPEAGAGFRHAISLINVTFANSLGESFTVGSVAEPYLIGTHRTN